MPPRIRLRSLAQLAELQIHRSPYICTRCAYATVTSTPTSNPDAHQVPTPPINTINPRYSPVQPPSHRDPAYRKSQLLRSYVSLLQTTPLIILFQHNNLKAQEWASIRRELERALAKADEQYTSLQPTAERLGPHIRLQVVKPTILEPALRIAEYYHPTPPSTETDAQSFPSEHDDPSLTHVLSRTAYTAALAHRNIHPLTPLLTGNIALLTLPLVSPLHLKTCLSILAPTPGSTSAFPAPSRRATPGYYEVAVQDGIKKLMLLGARVEGRVMDLEGTRWVGSIDGGIDGIRAQLVGMLQNAGIGLSQTLGSIGQGLWLTVEGRRRDLEPKEEEGKPEEKQA